MSERALTLNYSYPDLGKISVDFYSESKQVLEFLEKVHPDGLRHFERLDHLGRIRDVEKSAHHSVLVQREMEFSGCKISYTFPLSVPVLQRKGR
ncbi:MAG: hypothetical protein JRH08_11855, partial [Deltaproteobacteria bacterium]|nr:hypothetical protein [Deltaproteobacteria bacterium]